MYNQSVFFTKSAEIKEYEALESNKTDVGFELTKNVPNTTSRASCVVSVVTWLTLPST